MSNRKIFANQGPQDPHLKTNNFDLSFMSNLTARPGRIYPCYLKEAIAGGHYDIQANFAFDVDPLLYPLQTPIRAHMSFYKVPMRILWKNFKNFYGQVGSDGQINGANSYVMPYIKRANWCKEGSLADYMGIPTNKITAVHDTLAVYKGLQSSSPLCGYSVPDSEAVLGDSVLTFYDEPNNNDTLTFVVPKGFGLRTDGVGNTGTFIAYFASKTQPNKASLNSTFSALTPSDIFAVTHIRPVSVQDATANNRRNIKWWQWIVDPLTSGLRYLTGSSSDTSASVITGVEGDNVAIGSVAPIQCGDPINKTYDGNDYYITPIYFTFDNDFISAVNLASKKDDVHIVMSVPTAVWACLYERSARDFFGIDASMLAESEEGFAKSVSADFSIRATSWGLCYMQANVEHYVSKDTDPSPFESVNGADPVFPINALPFRAYEFVYRYFFENRRVTPFYKNGIPTYDEYITNDGDGADETEYDFFHAPYEYDMFTTCVPTPFLGNAPLVGVTTNSSTSATFNMVDGNNQAYSFDVETTQEGVITGISFRDGVAKTAPINVLQEAIEYGISIADFRNADALTIFQERHYRAGSKFQNLVYEFFGCSPPLGEEYPVYLGGCTRMINVDKIQNTAQSVGNPLGDFAGTARFGGQSEHIRCFCSEPSYIIGILYFSVTPTYTQALPAHFLKSKLLDYYNPVFANMSPQAVPKKWLTPLQLTEGHEDDTFGYNRPYVDYVQDLDQVHGEFRSSRADFIMQRLFGTAPDLNERFLTIHSEDLTDVYANREDTDKFYGLIHFDVKASLPIPRFSVPQII